MSERHSSAASFGALRERYSVSQPIQARVADGSSNAYQRRYRAGLRGMVWGQPRNGLPWKPYVYRGRGYDIYGDDDG